VCVFMKKDTRKRSVWGSSSWKAIWCGQEATYESILSTPSPPVFTWFWFYSDLFIFNFYFGWWWWHVDKEQRTNLSFLKRHRRVLLHSIFFPFSFVECDLIRTRSNVRIFPLDTIIAGCYLLFLFLFLFSLFWGVSLMWTKSNVRILPLDTIIANFNFNFIFLFYVTFMRSIADVAMQQLANASSLHSHSRFCFSCFILILVLILL